MFMIGKKKEKVEKEEKEQFGEPIVEILLDNNQEIPSSGNQNENPASDIDDEESGNGVADAEDSSAAMMAAFEVWLEDSMPEEMSREAAREAMGMVRDSLLTGDFDEALFDVIAKGSDYDRAVEEADAEGELRGRNAKIAELMTEDEEDGVPHPGANGGSTHRQRGCSIFDIARM